MSRWMVCGLAVVVLACGRISAEELPSAIEEVFAAAAQEPATQRAARTGE